MKSLIIDSSTKVLYCSLIIDKQVVFEEYIKGKNDHAKNIVLKINEALIKAGINIDELDEVICGVGPGSYTGVRMAVTVCKMMAVFLNIKLYTISTLYLMASGYDKKVLATIDARRGNAFAAIYDNDKCNVVLNEGMYLLDDLLKNDFDYHVTEDDYKVCPIKCLANKTLVNEPHLLTPNYLRDTEAERNLNA